MQHIRNGDRALSIPKVESCIKHSQEEDSHIGTGKPIGLQIHLPDLLDFFVPREFH